MVTKMTPEQRKEVTALGRFALGMIALVWGGIFLGMSFGLAAGAGVSLMVLAFTLLED
jgi:hypothetical protein